MQARDVDESRYMYDQLAVLSPIMLALTAATPVLKGHLVDTDVRWDTIASSVDDRTPAERGLLDGDQVRYRQLMAMSRCCHESSHIFRRFGIFFAGYDKEGHSQEQL